MIDILVTFIDLSILIVLLDDVYGLTNLRRLTKRRLRKFTRNFLKTSAYYWKKVGGNG